jgi:hypothetical protein
VTSAIPPKTAAKMMLFGLCDSGLIMFGDGHEVTTDSGGHIPPGIVVKARSNLPAGSQGEEYKKMTKYCKTGRGLRKDSRLIDNVAYLHCGTGSSDRCYS